MALTKTQQKRKNEQYKAKSTWQTFTIIDRRKRVEVTKNG